MFNIEDEIACTLPHAGPPTVLTLLARYYQWESWTRRHASSRACWLGALLVCSGDVELNPVPG